MCNNFSVRLAMALLDPVCLFQHADCCAMHFTESAVRAFTEALLEDAKLVQMSIMQYMSCQLRQHTVKIPSRLSLLPSCTLVDT